MSNKHDIGQYCDKPSLPRHYIVKRERAHSVDILIESMEVDDLDDLLDIAANIMQHGRKH